MMTNGDASAGIHCSEQIGRTIPCTIRETACERPDQCRVRPRAHVALPVVISGLFPVPRKRASTQITGRFCCMIRRGLFLSTATPNVHYGFVIHSSSSSKPAGI